MSADALIERFEQDKSRALGNTRRRDAGLYYTPRALADRVVEIALRHGGVRSGSVLDPCAGAGAFLVAAARAGLRDLQGTDLDPEALGVAREALRLCGAKARLTVADALRWRPSAATDLVIASPLYWYSVSTSVKHYLDYWTAWMRVPGADFLERMRGKTMWAVTAHTADNPTQVDPLLGTLRLSADYLGMRWGGELLAYGNRPDEAVEADGVRAAAQQLFAKRALTAS